MESVDALLQALSRTRVAIASQAGSEIEAIRNVAGAVKAVLEVSDGQIAEVCCRKCWSRIATAV